MTDTPPEETTVLRGVDFLYVNLSRGPEGIVASTVVRERETGRLIEVPGGPLTITRGQQTPVGPVEPATASGLRVGPPARPLVPPEHRVCRERTEDEPRAGRYL